MRKSLRLQHLCRTFALLESRGTEKIHQRVVGPGAPAGVAHGRKIAYRHYPWWNQVQLPHRQQLLGDGIRVLSRSRRGLPAR